MRRVIAGANLFVRRVIAGANLFVRRVIAGANLFVRRVIAGADKQNDLVCPSRSTWKRTSISDRPTSPSVLFSMTGNSV
ncbi:hypothetical protein LI951_02610 [Enterococcus sp. BWT-B8]|uniref:hypothetical protein n=1 Tax=Enterococcus sp. BWT-B8 TaxID=2885157 RepID=UPI001E530B68|nr:hypothetical protein [Enterococcus sp. BWT-B8]MCB5950952.1 hypothetical protein [Enterococcus sp. BWT-B8]